MRPAPLLLVLLLAWSLLGLPVAFGLWPRWSWAAAGAAIAVLALVDLLRLWRRPSPSIQRDMPEALALNVARPVTLRLESSLRQRVEVFDLAPGQWTLQGLPRRLTLKPMVASSFQYTVTPTARGRFELDGVHLRVHAPWRLWWQRRTLPPALSVRVYPNFAPLTRFALFSAEQASRLVGAHLKRRRGEGTDFHQMREYQDEKNQQLMLMIDTGRRMMASEGGLSHFDHVLNASLVVSYLALRQGDGVGLFASGGDSRWVAPQRGMGAIDALLRASYDLQARPVATDYLAAATELTLRQRRRSLVMLVTNVRDEDIEDLLAAVRLLQRQHLVCVASLRERELDDALDQPVDTLQDATQAGAIARYLQQRSDAHEALRSHRVMVLDVTADALPGALVERYLAVKRDGLL